jgi:IS605 OrfB family transposase
LGEKKQRALRHDNEETLSRIINTSINKLVATRQPSKIATEDLSHAFKFKGSKKINRRLSRFLKGKMKERIEFKSETKGFGVERVNCAYGSQGCPICDKVDKKNRNGDKFKCSVCGHEGHSDTVAARAYKARLHDPEIKLRMKPKDVRAVLDSRHRGYLEACDEAVSAASPRATVHALTPDVVVRNTMRAGKKGGREPVSTLRPLGERKVKLGALT